jgi:hypothetical protein
MDKDKYSILLGPFMSYEEKEVLLILVLYDKTTYIFV